MQTNDVLYRLPFVVLCTSRFKEFVVSREPFEYLLISVTGTSEEWVLPQVVLLLQALPFVQVEYLQNALFFGYGCKHEGRLALEVGH